MLYSSGQLACFSGKSPYENETSNITIPLATNISFEWKENSGDNIYDPAANDTITDMRIRELVPIVQ